MNNGSLTFALSTNLSGATVISISAHGLVPDHQRWPTAYRVLSRNFLKRGGKIVQLNVVIW